MIVGGGGGDYLYGGNGADSLLGGSGIDGIFGGDGNDELLGDSGSDLLIGGAGEDKFFGGTEVDTVAFSTSSKSPHTEDIALSLDGSILNTGVSAGDSFDSVENVDGGTGNDLIAGNEVGNRIDGSDGNDVLFGRGGNDTLVGGNSNDSLSGGGANSLYGEAGDDELDASFGTNLMDGGDGNDTVFYTGLDGLTLSLGNDTATGGIAAGDTFNNIENVSGTDGRDLIYGDANANFLLGNKGDDSLIGEGNLVGGYLDGGLGLGDTIYGGEGDDFLCGESMIGGIGNDTFCVGETVAFGDRNIADFEDGDRLFFITFVQLGYVQGTVDRGLDGDYFESTTSNQATSGTGTAKFVFNKTDDTLWLDLDDENPDSETILLVTMNNHDIELSDFVY